MNSGNQDRLLKLEIERALFSLSAPSRCPPPSNRGVTRADFGLGQNAETGAGLGSRVNGLTAPGLHVFQRLIAIICRDHSTPLAVKSAGIADLDRSSRTRPVTDPREDRPSGGARREARPGTPPGLLPGQLTSNSGRRLHRNEKRGHR